MKWREIGNIEIPIGKPWFEVRLSRASYYWPSAATVPLWPIAWQGWLLALSMPAGIGFLAWLLIEFGLEGGVAFWALFGPPMLIWVACVGMKTKVIDSTK